MTQTKQPPANPGRFSGDFDARAVLTPEILGALLGLAALSLAAIPLKARFDRS